MTKQTTFRKNESIFEIRYKENSLLLDKRGEWAKIISEKMNLEHWRIDTNRIDIFSKEDTNHLFLSYRNCGLTLNDVPNKDFFNNYSRKFLELIFQKEILGSDVQIERIGVRTLFCTPYSGNYNSLLKKFSERYIRIPEETMKIIGDGVSTIDIGAHVNFRDELGNFNTTSGPMPKQQYPNFFSLKDGNFPEVGLFYDIDYWVAPNKKLHTDEIVKKIQDLYAGGWDRHSRISSLVTKG